MSGLTLGVVSHHPGLHMSMLEDQDAAMRLEHELLLAAELTPEQLSQFQRNLPVEWIEELGGAGRRQVESLIGTAAPHRTTNGFNCRTSCWLPMFGVCLCKDTESSLGALWTGLP